VTISKALVTIRNYEHHVKLTDEGFDNIAFLGDAREIDFIRMSRQLKTIIRGYLRFRFWQGFDGFVFVRFFARVDIF
jgi:hypothetical protein